MHRAPLVQSQNRSGGFALVIALSLMAFILLLLVSLVTITRVETQSAAVSLAQTEARANAMLGLQIAVGELQKHAGADQRVTVPATTVFPSKDATDASGDMYDFFRNRTSAPRGTFLTATDRAAFDSDLSDWWQTRQPRWTGVLDSSLRRDGGISAQEYGEFDRNQSARWLISGNEGLEPGDPDYLTPDDPNGVFTANPSPSNDLVWLVGEGSATDATTSIDEMDGRVKAQKQTIDRETQGHYAYWVADESTKANFAVRDPYFNETNITSEEYRNRLQVPQRLGWERIRGFADVFDDKSLSVNDPRFTKIVSRQQIGLIEDDFVDPANDGSIDDGALNRNFHSITSHSRSLLTNTATGGLKKDLTTYFESNQGPGSTEPLLDDEKYEASDPRFGDNNSGFPRTNDHTKLPLWETMKEWHDSNVINDSGAVPPERGRAPIYANYQFFFGFTHENGKIQMHILPMVTLWNPFDATLTSSNYTIKARVNMPFYRMGFATRGISDATPSDQSDGLHAEGADGAEQTDFLVHNVEPLGWYVPGSSNYKDWRTSFNTAWDNNGPALRFSPFDAAPMWDAPLETDLDDSNITFINFDLTTSLGPGEVKTFVVDTMQKVDPSDLHDELTSVTLTSTQGLPTDFPGSFYFDFASFIPNGGAIPDQANDVRWYSEMSLGDTVNNAMALFNGSNLLWFNPDLGEPGNWSNHLTVSTSGTLPPKSGGGANIIESRNVDEWRRLYHLDDWLIQPKNVNARSPSAAIIPHHRGRLSPLVEQWFRIYDVKDDEPAQEGLNTSQRAFSVFNLAAESLSGHPLLDGGRNRNSNNNTDKFQKIAFLEAEVSGGNNDAMEWFDEQYDFTTGRGFTLVGWQQKDASREELGLSEIPIRQVRRASSKLLSLGQLQQVNLSKFVWQPSFPVGNSEASPYVDRARVAGIESYEVGAQFTGGTSIRNKQEFPNNADNDFLDLSYLLNESLWDTYFLSSIPQSGAVSLDNSIPLPNSRHKFTDDSQVSANDVRDFDTAAAFLENVGALNVNSTSVEAWRALLTAFRDLELSGDGDTNPDNTVPVVRTLEPEAGPIEYTFDDVDPNDIGAVSSNRDYGKLFTGFRYMTDAMIESLAERIVDEVRLRGPFYSLADFVNRRLVEPDDIDGVWQTARTANLSTDHQRNSYTMPSGYDPLAGLAGLNGALQRAINLSGLNGGPNYPGGDDPNDRIYDVEQDPEELGNNNRSLVKYGDAAYYLDTEHLAGVPAGEGAQLFSHAPGMISQADILSMIGPALTPRGDTFIVRSYGDAINQTTGKVIGKAWLEAVVQRRAPPVSPSSSSKTSPDYYEPADEFGRRFEVLSIRWLTEDEV